MQVNRAQFQMRLPEASLAAYRIARASAAWVPENHDLERVRRFIEGYYRIAVRRAGLQTDAAHAAELELRYWDVHRQLINETDKSEFVDALAELHRALFGVEDAVARLSALERVEANNSVDRITQGWTDDIPSEWQEVERHLHACYSLINGEVAPAAAT